MTDLTLERIAEMEDLLQAATPGPWKWQAEDSSMLSLYGPGEWTDHVLSCRACPSCVKRNPDGDGRCMQPRKVNADLIAAARNDLPTLLALAREALEFRATKERAFSAGKHLLIKCPKKTPETADDGKPGSKSGA